MASVISVQAPTAQKLSGNQWKLSVIYTAVFSQFEVSNFNFSDSVQVWEDDTFSDDQLTGFRDEKSFNPSTLTVQRTKSTIVSGDTLDTELGAEEIYLKIRLRNTDLNQTFPTKNSSNINIAP